MELRALLPLLLLLLPGTPTAARGPQAPPDCRSVRREFSLREVGPEKWVPERARAGAELQVCSARGASCCTRRMEDAFVAAGARDAQQLLQTSSSPLRFLLSRTVTSVHEAFVALSEQAEARVGALFRDVYRALEHEAAGPVRDLFAGARQYVLGSRADPHDLATSFFDGLFPLVYNRLINPGLSGLAPPFAECLRHNRRELRPFGPFPRAIASQLGRSLSSLRSFAGALGSGLEAVNATELAVTPRDSSCTRALARLRYCPLCGPEAAAAGPRPARACIGYCLNVLRGCLASLAEMSGPWMELVRAVEELSAEMHGSGDPEGVLLNLHAQLNEAIMHAQLNGPKISVAVTQVCGPPQSSEQGPERAWESEYERLPPPPGRQHYDRLASIRREFHSSLRLYRTFFATLAETLCHTELASHDSSLCWNGETMTESDTHRVVENGVAAQSHNPEVRVTEVDAAVQRAVRKLQHDVRAIRERGAGGRRDAMAGGPEDGGGPGDGGGRSDAREEGAASGDRDCDDEDDCDDDDDGGGSGGADPIKPASNAGGTGGEKPTPTDKSHPDRRRNQPGGGAGRRLEAGGLTAALAAVTAAAAALLHGPRGLRAE
uniref:Glypican-5 n=1 Tax=Petromyzon marinus TaxID=7757 RepID=A0AAJ7U8X0_PETMA|nr:glypican-5 [Petromyzon marinus]